MVQARPRLAGKVGSEPGAKAHQKRVSIEERLSAAVASKITGARESQGPRSGGKTSSDTFCKITDVGRRGAIPEAHRRRTDLPVAGKVTAKTVFAPPPRSQSQAAGLATNRCGVIVATSVIPLRSNDRR